MRFLFYYISFCLKKSHFVLSDHYISFCRIYVYKQYSLFEVPIYIPEEKNKEFENDERAKGILTQVVDKYSHISAYDLSLWSHLPGGPWNQTVYGIKGDKNSGWNKEISDDLIKNYFAKE